MPSKLEKDDEATIKKWCKGNGVIFIKFTPFGEKGWPDRIAIFPLGGHVWVELKRRGKEPTPLQYHRLQTLTDQGCVAVWFDNAAECIAFLEECLAYTATALGPPPTVEQPSGLRLVESKGDENG